MVADTQRTPTPSRVSATLAEGRLGVPEVVFFALAGAAPLTVVAGVATAAYGITGITGIPVVYLATAVILGVFAVGYVAMSRHIVNAGAFYTYITHGLGRIPGVASANVAVLAYNMLQTGLYGGWGVVVAGYTGQRFGWTLNWWQWALIAWACVAVLGLLRVKINSVVLAVLLVAEVLVAFVYDVVMVANPAGGTVTWTTLNPGQLMSAGISAAFVIAITGFSGFEATVVLSEETRNPRTTTARATYLALGLTGALYALSAWAMSVGTGPDQIVARAGAESNELLFNLAGPHLPAFMGDTGHLLFATSLFAALLAFHNMVARYLFSLGREHVLPSALGMASPRTGAPVVASLVQSMIGAGVIALYATGGWDPFARMFFWLGVSGGLGLLLLMIACSVAVVGYFMRRPGDDNVWRRVIAPVTAAAALGLLLYFTLSQYDALLGVPAGHPAAWMFPAAFGAVAALGALWALYLKMARPGVYARIGLGAGEPVRVDL